VREAPKLLAKEELLKHRFYGQTDKGAGRTTGLLLGGRKIKRGQQGLQKKNLIKKYCILICRGKASIQAFFQRISNYDGYPKRKRKA